MLSILEYTGPGHTRRPTGHLTLTSRLKEASMAYSYGTTVLSGGRSAGPPAGQYRRVNTLCPRPGPGPVLCPGY